MSELSCANCPFDIEQPNGKPFCIQDATCEISVNWFNECEQKIYNQALEDFERKMAFFCFGLKASEGKLCRVDVVENELQRVKRQLMK